MERLADNFGALFSWWLPFIAALLAIRWLAPKISRAYHDWRWRGWKRRNE